jgi:hypothetical protein
MRTAKSFKGKNQVVAMSGKAPSKKLVCRAVVYLHEKDPSTNSRRAHIDVECKGLNKIIKPGERAFAGGKQGGLFIALSNKMIGRVGKNKKKKTRGKKNKRKTR